MIQVVRCQNCGKALSDDFERSEPLIDVKMSLSRRGCECCNSTSRIETSVGFCCFQCLWDYINDGNLTTLWDDRCGDR